MQYRIENLDQLKQITQKLIEQFEGEKIWVFRGEMGAGKTTLIKAICENLGVEDVVNSPSFAIVNEYASASKEVVYHFDFYRLKQISEALDLGYEDYLYSGCYCFIEWPEKIEALLPTSRVEVLLEFNQDNSRSLSVMQIGC